MYYEKENVLLDVVVSYEGSKACTLYTSNVLFKKPREQLQTSERVDNFYSYALPLTLFIHSNYLEGGLIFLYKFIFQTNCLPILKKYDYRKFHSQLHSYPVSF